MPRDAITLADVRSPTIEIECAQCSRHGRYNVQRLIAAHGADANPPLACGLAGGLRPGMASKALRLLASVKVHVPQPPVL
jgi:hypothetical protein